MEFIRLHDITYMSFYVLANLGRLDPQLLAEWINKQDEPRWRCDDMNIWLVDSYFRSSGGTSPASERHFTLVGGEAIAEGKALQSRWNTPWDVHHSLLGARDVEVSEFPMIEVLEIPMSLPESLDSQVKKNILSNFVQAYSGLPKSADGSLPPDEDDE